MQRVGTRVAERRRETPGPTRRTFGGRTPRIPMPVALAIGAVGILLVFTVRAVTPALGPWSLPNQVQDLLTLSISVIIESLPFVILGILLSILVQVWIPDRWIVTILPRNPWARRAVISFIGILLPVCECGNVPLARGLMIKGFSVSESMTFLLAAPILNPITIVTTGQAFGLDSPIFIWRIVGGFVIANVIGWMFSRHPDQDSLLTDRFAAECALPDQHEHGDTRWKKSIELFTHEAATIMPALFIGSLVAGLVQVAVPRAVLLGLGSNPVWSILAMMVLAFVISVCSNVDSFFILPFANTFMPGSITAFLVFGPLIDIKMLTLMRTTFRLRVLVILSVVVGLMAALIGLVVNVIA